MLRDELGFRKSRCLPETVHGLCPSNCGECYEGDLCRDEEQRPTETSGSETVAVQSDPENEVDTVPRHEHALKGHHRADSHPKAGPFAGNPSVENDQIAEERNQRPGFLGIPIPKSPPGIVRPYST